MSSDPNQEPVESSQSLAASEPTVYVVGSASSPASQPDETVFGQPLASSEPLPSQGTTIATPPPPPLSSPAPRKKSRRWLWIGLAVLVLVIIGAVTTTILLLNNNPNGAVTSVVQGYY